MSAAEQIDLFEPVEWTGRTNLRIGATTLRVARWCSIFGLRTEVALRRIAAGWPPHDAVSQPGHVRTHWDVTPYAEDREAQRFVREHPQGATLEEIAEVLGVTKQHVLNIEKDALISVELALVEEDS